MDFWPDSVEIICAGVCGTCTFLIHKAFRSYSVILNSLQCAPDLKCQMILNQTGSIVQNGVYGFVYGAVYPANGNGISISPDVNPTPALTSKVTGVVSQKTLTELIMTHIFGFWSSDDRIISEDWEYVPFKIIQDKLSITVSQPMKLESVALQVVGEKFEPSKLSLSHHLFTMLRGYYVAGIRHMQKMLITGTEIVGVGRLVLKPSGFYLENDESLPFMVTTESREEIIGMYRSVCNYLKLGCLIFSAATAFFIGRIIYKYMKKRGLILLVTKSDQIRSSAIAATKDCNVDALPDELKCIVCYGFRNSVLIPCAHVAVCLSCAEKLDKCPVCRATVKRIQPLLFS